MGGSLRVAVLGAPGVGKTAIIRQFLFGDYPERHQPTDRPRLYRPAVLLDGAVYDLSIRDGDGAGSGQSPRVLEVAAPGAEGRVRACVCVCVGVMLGAHVRVCVDSPRVPNCFYGLKDECVSWRLCASSLLAGLEVHRPGLMSGDFRKVAFSRWHKHLYIYLLPLVGLDQCVAKHACTSLRVSFMCLGT